MILLSWRGQWPTESSIQAAMLGFTRRICPGGSGAESQTVGLPLHAKSAWSPYRHERVKLSICMVDQNKFVGVPSYMILSEAWHL